MAARAVRQRTCYCGTEVCFELRRTVESEESVESVFELSFSHPPSEGPVRVVPKLLRNDGLYQNISHIISDRLSPSDVLLGNYEGTVLSHTFGLSGIDIAGNHSLSLILYGRSTSEYQITISESITVLEKSKPIPIPYILHAKFSGDASTLSITFSNFVFASI